MSSRIPQLVRSAALLATLIVVPAASAGHHGPASSAAQVKRDVAVQFVAAANRGDYRTVCRLYSTRYLKVSQARCRSLYRWGARLYGPYDYRTVGRRMLPNGRQWVDLIRWQNPSFIELAPERKGWRVVAGGW